MTKKLVEQAAWLADALTDLDVLFSTANVPELAATLVELAEKMERRHESGLVRIVESPTSCAECGGHAFVCKREVDELVADLRDQIAGVRAEMEARTDAYHRVRAQLDEVRQAVAVGSDTWPK